MEEEVRTRSGYILELQREQEKLKTDLQTISEQNSNIMENLINTQAENQKIKEHESDVLKELEK